MLRNYSFTANLSRSVHERLDAFLLEQKDLWNAALEERIAAYQKSLQRTGKGKGVGYYQQQGELTEWRQDSPENRMFSASAQRSALRRLDKAFQSFFRRVKAGEKPGFPRFKPAHRMRSFETEQFSIHTKGRAHSVAVKGIGRFRFKGALPDQGKAKVFRVVKTARRVSVCLTWELPALRLVDARPPVGMDVGVDNLYALSNGEIAPARQRDKSRIKHFQRKLARAKKGSNNRVKKRASLAKACQSERERTEGHLHELTAKLIKEHGTKWFVEDLDIQKMTAKGKAQKRGLNRSILERGWGSFIAKLTYKAESAGGWVEKVNAAYTSKTCNKCGGVNHHMGRTDPMDCAHCNHQDHRDVNAAKNMLLGDWVSLAGGASRHARSRAVKAELLSASA